MSRLPDRARSVVSRARARPRDLAMAAALTAGAFVLHLVQALVTLPRTDDLPLFGTDTARVARHMAVRAPMLDRGQFHPLFPLMTQPPVRLLTATGLERDVAIRVVIAAYGALAVAGVFVLARRRLPALSAAAPTVLFAVSAASTVYFSIPETFGVGAAAVVWTLVIVDGWRASPSPVAAASAIVLAPAAVVSGAVVAAVGVVRRLRGAIAWATTIALGAGAFVVLLLVQRVIAGTRFSVTLGGESEFLTDDLASSIGQSFRTVLIDVWALPAHAIRDRGVSVQDAAWLGGGIRSTVGVLCIVLSGLIIAGSARNRRDPLVMIAAIGVAVHLVLHSVYGDEPFLYAAMLLPLVTALLIAAAASPLRRPVLAICWLVAALVAVTNQVHLQQIADAVSGLR